MRLVAECMRQIRCGADPRELALRYTSGGRPRKLDETQEQVCCAVFGRDEASLHELATIYGLTPNGMKNVLKRGGVW